MKNRSEIFEKMSIKKAVFTLALPTILSQLVSMIYNLTDTYFIGQVNDPYQVAAVNVAFPIFFVLIVFANLFGIGGGSLVSRLLGKKDYDNIKKVTISSLFGAFLMSLVYSIFVFVYFDQLLGLLGTSVNTIGHARDYLFWTVVIGAVPSTLGMVFGHLLRSEGFSKQASVGIAIGGVLNVILDPIFIFGFDMGVEGAALATMIANTLAMIYYVILIIKLGDQTHMSFDFRLISFRKYIWIPILAIGLPAASASLFNVFATTIINNLTSVYGDYELAAMGIVKKIDMIPLHVTLGISQGILPLIAYNYAAKNYKRMRDISKYGMKLVMIFSMLCVVLFVVEAPLLVRIFIKDSTTVHLGERFLRIAVLAMPVMGVNFVINTAFQAMGKGRQSLLLSISRQGLINIPLLYLMDYWFGLYGIIWTQLLADLLTFAIGFYLFTKLTRKLHEEEDYYNAQLLTQEV
ncbi:Na+-driven multidrug efflux pump [Paracholeplasma brassicae]|jgi:putative MATE family efflux protein|uniref:Multidrug export protein MepA n=1 Tax=Acholeplasma brassicae TaxID=61635 RepID=U4KQW3_9MOLU|nr:MATE family efflux transporter [Paracholeplasma brassicae]CCV65208.1 Na+-driven multidrug efflux pump [Paracholeplasma brassicae]